MYLCNYVGDLAVNSVLLTLLVKYYYCFCVVAVPVCSETGVSGHLCICLWS